ncbi:hypothetical protein CXG81DRAFT_9087 [Caulochytrium protostelioides]|uniref:ornithine carbamoyltransferase n=1 Tax=Caulochytrium protostelioides TaxID=1555241 RepID=A0A4V1IVE7_9FUNG|nr:hypothetical protein CXG81DRAFT_9087 [Caulochytrium protostelioides]|eukprot:RKP03799.1 hypothetical protein CXG81DRAFT_9087 [Caulochytrium protostelioides]
MLQTPAPRHLLSLADVPAAALIELVQLSLWFKHQVVSHPTTPPPLATIDRLRGRTLALLFTKKSTRTRLSAETAWAKLGGAHTVFLGSNDIHLGKGESLHDTAVVLGSMVDALLARVHAHADLETLAAQMPPHVPVINALSDRFHPLQALADLATLVEMRGCSPAQRPGADAFVLPSVDAIAAVFDGLQVAWVGDANNVVNSLALALPRLGAGVRIATPRGIEMDADVLDRLRHVDAVGGHAGAALRARVVESHSPQEAVSGADVVVTDTWTSMGHEDGADEARFAGFTVDADLMAHANPDAGFLHCLPRKGAEVSDAVFYGPQSWVWTEAQYRQFTKMAVFTWLMGIGRP